MQMKYLNTFDFNKDESRQIKLSLKQAREQDSIVYWTGKPCVNGHTTWRMTASKKCRQCIREKGHKDKNLGFVTDTGAVEKRRLIEEASAKRSLDRLDELY